MILALLLSFAVAAAEAPPPATEEPLLPRLLGESEKNELASDAAAPAVPDDAVVPAAPLGGVPVIAELRLSLSNPNEGELQRLEGFLRDVLLRPADHRAVDDVVARLDRLQRYKKPICRLSRIDEDRSVMACTLRRTRVVNRVVVETREVVSLDGANTGLPLAILENDLKKRVLLRPGEPLDDESGGRSRVAKQRARIEDFLEREGYYGAQVRIVTRAVNDDDGDNDVDVVIRVLGGSFVKVRRVNLVNFGPLSQRKLEEAYGAMCANGEGLLDGVFVWNITSCFNRRRLQATTDRFVNELRELGYPEARLRVTEEFVDPRSHGKKADDDRVVDDDDDCLLSLDSVRDLGKSHLPLPPKCVDLNVEVIAGKNVVTRFHLEDAHQPIIDDPGFAAGTARFIRETFTEPLSRFWQTTFDNPTADAADTAIITDDLERRLSFDEAGSVDETEAKLSLERVEGYLAERGYSAPELAFRYQEYESGDVAVDYTIRPGTPTPVAAVRLIGNETFTEREILKEVELAAAPRNFQSTGFLGKTALDDDALRLREFYGNRGFPEVDVQVRAMRDDRGRVEVVFVIVEGQRFVIDRVVFAGGDPALGRDVLAVLAHCQTHNLGANVEGKRELGTECKGSPLLPGEMDADARRVEAVYAARGYPPVESVVELGFGPPRGSGPPPALVRVSVFPAGAEGDARSDPKVGNVKRLKVGEIFVEGNLETRREVLLREMGLDDLKPGADLDPQKIANGVSRLRRTGLFSRVDLEMLGASGTSDSDVAHVRVSVEERPSSTVDLSVGFSTQQLFSLRLEGRNKNLFGSMFDGSASADLGLFIGRSSQVRTQIRWPRLLGTDLSLSLTPVLLTYTDQPAGAFLPVPSTSAGQKINLAWERPDRRRRLFQAGSAVSLDWRASNLHPLIDDKLTVGVAIDPRFDWLDVDGDYFAPLSSEAFSTLDGLLDLLGGSTAQIDADGRATVVRTAYPVPVIALTPRVAFSNIDNPFDPKSGLGADLFVRTVPFALAPYAVIGGQTRGYVSFFDDRVTFAGSLRLRWGIVGTADECGGELCEWALMQNDLLRIDGERTVRGVDENVIGVLSPDFDQSLRPVLEGGDQRQRIRPGLFGAVANFEVRFLAIRQLFVGELKPALFTDIGLSTDDFKGFDIDNPNNLLADSRYVVSVGAGLRYVLPVGPLAFDVAWAPFHEAAGPLPVRYSILLGYIF
ncbi:MAG: POTRA domain-containing protein [Deltaproteobacteria bacterium]|nr:POTRA domain-containing protein [Deltaproteobacteria bacterium]